MTTARHSVPRVVFLDFLRGYSLLAVVWFHALQPVATGWFAQAIQFGSSGVHALLFLSGYGLMVSARHQPDLKGFYARRLQRVLLPYVLFVTLVASVNCFVPLYPDDGWYEYLSHVLLFRMFDEAALVSYGEHLWFISTIVQLYLLFPFLYRAQQAWGGGRLLAGAALISACFTGLILALGRAELRIYNSCGLIYLWEFVLGMYAAGRWSAGGVPFWEWPANRWLLATGMSLLALVGFAIGGGTSSELLNNPAALLAFVGSAVWVYHFLQQQGWRLPERAIVWFAGISYEVYLVHGFILTRVFFWLAPDRRLGQGVAIVLGVALSIAVGMAYHTLLAATVDRRAAVQREDASGERRDGRDG